MTKILTAALFAIVVSSVAVHALPTETVARSTPVQPSFDIAMPAAQESVDATVVASVAPPFASSPR